MKKLFAGLLVGTMVIAGTGTVFAATGGQTDNLAVKIVELAKSDEAKAPIIPVASIEAVSADELTPEQKAEIEKDKQAFQAKVKEMCKEAGYDYNTIMEKLENGTLTDEELKVFNEAGMIMAVTSQPAEVDTQEIIPMTKSVEQ